jgi:hypothetical protein
MPIYHSIDHKIVGRDELIRTALRDDEGQSFAVGTAAAAANARNFVDIGFGKPLNIVLRRLYTGRYPQKHLFSNSKSMLLSSALKDATTTSAGARAINMLKQQVTPYKAFSGPAALEEGTSLLYYSPAAASPLITLTVELVFEDFDPSLFTTVSKLFTSLSSIPIFMPASGYLMGASTVVQLAGDIGQALLDGTPVLSETMQLDFSFGGGGIPTAGFWIFSPTPIDLTGYSFDPIKGLLSSSSKEYDGDEPCVVLSIDGTKQEGLSNFTPLLASASLLSQFYNQKPGTEVITDSLVSAVTLSNDLIYRKKVESLAAKLGSLQASSPDYVSIKAQYDAFSANIEEPLLKPEALLSKG